MTFRLGEHVVCGELLNTSNYCTHGYLGLRGTDRPVSLQLTGNCEKDLQGRHIRFEAAEVFREEGVGDKPPDGLAWQQIGPTGIMTADDWVRIMPCSVKEFLIRSRLKEPPPTTWERRLYLEWYSQNGRVVVEVACATIEYLDGEDWKPLPANSPKPEPGDEGKTGASATGMEITIVRSDEDGERTERLTYGPKKIDKDRPGENDFQTISDDLQKELDARTAEIDRAVGGMSAPPDVIGEMELMDHLIDNEMGDPVGSLFSENRRLPRPEDLDDERVEIQLKCLLGELALCGVALHVCEHFSPRDAYRLLLEKICWGERVFKELGGTGWTQNFMTSEYCKACEEEDEHEYVDLEVDSDDLSEDPPTDEDS